MPTPPSRQLPLFRVGIPSDDDDLPLPAPSLPVQALEAGHLADHVSPVDAPAGEQVSMFDPLEQAGRAADSPPSTRLRTYLEVAEVVGLRRLQTLLELPATFFLFDPAPLQRHWRLETLLEVRERTVAHLRGAFDDLSRHGESAVHDASVVLWGSTRRRQLPLSGTGSLVLNIIVASDNSRALEPFLFRVGGFPGFLGTLSGAPPLELGAELLAIRADDRLYHLFPVELQPVPLSAILVG